MSKVIHPQPQRLALHVGKITAVMRVERQWVMWKYEPRPAEGKPNKASYTPDGINADVTRYCDTE